MTTATVSNLKLVSSNFKVVHKKFPKKYKRGEYVPRPFRVWNTKENKPLRWRCFRYIDNCFRAANNILLDVKVGTVLDIYDARNGKHLGYLVCKVYGAKREVTIWRNPK